MYQEDYVLRMIRMFTQALARILGLVDHQNYSQAQAAIHEVYRDLFGLNSSSILYLPEAELVEMLTFAGEVDTERLRVLAELLILEGKINLAKGDIGEGNRRHLKALNVLLEIAAVHREAVSPSIATAIENLVEDLREAGLPPETQAGLFFFYEDSGQFARARDEILDYIQKSKTPDEILRHCVAFYRRLLSKSDEELSAGGLPRSEVELGLKRLLLRLEKEE